MPPAAAFFDLDRTLISGSSGQPWVRAARRAGLVSRSQMLRWGLDGLRFRLRGASDEATGKVLAEIKALLMGTPERALSRLAPEVLARVLPRIYPEMLDEVHAHQDAGRATFIVSAAGDEIVSLIAKVLYMDGGIGTAYAVDEAGLFTGELSGAFMYGEGKVEAMRRYAADHEIDLAQSWAYSDSASDLPMLRAVGNPVVVNPDAELAAIALDGDWRVMRFERLGRQLAIGGAMLFAAVAGGVGRSLAGRRTRGQLRAHRIGPWTGQTSPSRASRAKRS